MVGCCGGEEDLVLLWPGADEGAVGMLPGGRRESSGEVPPAPAVEAIGEEVAVKEIVC